MVALPNPTAVTTPVEEIDATLGSEDDHRTSPDTSVSE